jgi:hypothetical protein
MPPVEEGVEMEARGLVVEAGIWLPGRPRSFTGLPNGLPDPAGISTLAAEDVSFRELGDRKGSREPVPALAPWEKEPGRTSDRLATVRGAEESRETVGR